MPDKDPDEVKGAADERRVHARIRINLRCSVLTLSGSYEGRVRDLSHGGALIELPESAAFLGDSVTIDVELPDASTSITVLGEVVRVEESSEGEIRCGIRFSIVEPRQREELKHFIDSLLAGDGVGRRRHPRVRRRLAIDLGTADPPGAMMSDISRGGVGIECDLPVVVNEEINVEIRLYETSEPVTCAAVVRHVRTIGEGRYHVGVEFVAPTPQIQKEIEELVEQMMSSYSPDG